jgi:hypothetical protein
MKCLISQPTFLPWIGWFDLVEQADLMIIYDTAQFSKQSWQQRNRIRTIRGLEYLTVPVKTSGRSNQKIIDVEISMIDFEEYFKNRMIHAYSKAPFFEPVMDDLEKKLPHLLANRKLSHLNEGLIKFCCEWLGITTRLVRASDLNIDGQRGEYLAKVCEEFNCDEYISTEGAEKYLIEDYNFFEQKKINVKIYKYEHPIYSQLIEPFIPYASVIDLIMMYGHSSKEVMQKAQRYTHTIAI